MYRWYAELCHLPKSWTVVSGTLPILVVVAAPVLNLCPLNREPSTPAAARAPAQ